MKILKNNKTAGIKHKCFSVFVFSCFPCFRVFVFSCFCVFVFSCFCVPARSATSPDAIAIRVIPNPDHYSARRWYT
ncbi:MAG: hypothetical protein V1825_04220, partial [Candidatus Falkowbacteria bacterium]